MPNKITIYHNPRCSKSRAAFELLTNREIDFKVVEYLKNPPDKDTLKNILILLDMQPQELMRKGDSNYKDLGIGKIDMSSDELIDLMISHPSLIERPIVTTSDAAAIGRPLDNIIELIDEL